MKLKLNIGKLVALKYQGIFLGDILSFAFNYRLVNDQTKTHSGYDIATVELSQATNTFQQQQTGRLL